MKITVTSVLVDDQKKALAFYTDVLGFQEKTATSTSGTLGRDLGFIPAL